ncbi:MAG TPA: serine/threonine-protein kinase [Gemmatimonadaceae bacterium]|jgi:serine/threonine-protein kinase
MRETPEASNDPLIGQLIADRYQILSVIGEGGMGRVYLAEHVRMGRKSAVKVINPALATTADAISRFNREAANACKINHPNVAQVYDFGEMADGTLYLAMEYIDGETLDRVVASTGALPPVRAAQITKQIADALYAAHHLGIVHRDLKPENVMIARHLDGSDWVKVVDFGIAKTIQRDGTGSQTVTTAGVSLGTPEYMSPEQLAGEKLDHRTDVYSLGLLLFNMLTGELPYPKLTSKETLVRRLTSRPNTLAEVRPDVAWPAGLQQALDRAIAPEAADRYDSVADFGREVLRVAEAGQPATAAAATAVATTAGVSRPVAVAPETPNVKRSASPRVDDSVARRRALPWAIAAACLVAVAVVAQVYARHPDAAVMTSRDSASSSTSLTDTTAVASVATPPTPPSVVHADSMSRTPVMSTPSVSAPLHMTHPSAPATFEQKLADSVRRMVDKIPLAELSRMDSMLTQIQPDIERAQRAGERRGIGAGAAAAEIRAHIARMKERFENGDARGARQEFAKAASELPIVRDLDPDPEHTAILQRELGAGIRDLVATCYRKRADSTLAPGIRCENLVGLPNRFRPRQQ